MTMPANARQLRARKCSQAWRTGTTSKTRKMRRTLTLPYGLLGGCVPPSPSQLRPSAFDRCRSDHTAELMFACVQYTNGEIEGFPKSRLLPSNESPNTPFSPWSQPGPRRSLRRVTSCCAGAVGQAAGMAHVRPLDGFTVYRPPPPAAVRPESRTSVRVRRWALRRPMATVGYTVRWRGGGGRRGWSSWSGL